MSTHHKPLKIAALGMQQRTYSTLQLFFNGPCQKNYVLVEEKLADISIIDMDGYHASSVFEFHKRQYPDRPAILVSLSDQQSDDNFYVQKPIQLSALATALGEATSKIQKIEYYSAAKKSPAIANIVQQPPTLYNIANQTKSEQVALKKRSYTDTGHSLEITASPASLEALSDTGIAEILPFPLTDIKFNPHNPLQLSKLQFDHEHNLLGYFQQAYKIAINEQRNVLLEGPWRPIIILHETRQMLVGKNYRHLYAIAAMPFQSEEVTISYIEEDISEVADDNRTLKAIEPFLWKLAVRTSRGRVPKGTSFNIPIRLLRWPNFTRTSVTPHALRIAALWAKQPMSLSNTAEVLAIPLHFVFIFYSAALSLDLVSIASNTVEKKPEVSPVKQHKHRSIFQFLLKKMRSAS